MRFDHSHLPDDSHFIHLSPETGTVGLGVPDAHVTAEESLHFRVGRVNVAFNAPYGKIVAGLIGKGQNLSAR
jgi:hypothetical protein